MHSSASEPRLKLESLVSLVYTNTLAAWERGRPGLAVHQVLGRSGSTVNMESELTACCAVRHRVFPRLVTVRVICFGGQGWPLMLYTCKTRVNRTH